MSIFRKPLYNAVQKRTSFGLKWTQIKQTILVFGFTFRPSIRTSEKVKLQNFP